jgi:hypothetical protein
MPTYINPDFITGLMLSFVFSYIRLSYHVYIKLFNLHVDINNFINITAILMTYYVQAEILQLALPMTITLFTMFLCDMITGLIVNAVS